MRRRMSLTALALAGALLLASCGSSGEADPTPTPTTSVVEAGTDGPFPEATGSFGEQPELTFPEEGPATTLQARLLTEGDGETVAAGDLLVAHYLGQIWGGEVFDSSYGRGAPSTFPIGIGLVIEGWDAGLVGQRVGSRVLLTIPPDVGYGESGNPAIGVDGDDTLAMVVDIVDTYGPDVAGQPDAEVASAGDLPVEVGGALGEPVTVVVPEGAEEPVEVSTTVLARGSGDAVQAGQLVVQYAAAYWDNSETQSTWQQGTPTAIQLGSGGSFDGLIGVPIGSRALVLIPAGQDTPPIAVVIDVVAQVSTR